MPDTGRTTIATYSSWVGFIFIFNIIVGTGALTLPSAFVKAGWMLSLSFIIILAFLSYVTVTFVIEAMACTNAVRNWQNLQVLTNSQNVSESTKNEEEQSTDETGALLPREANADLERIPLNCQNSSFFYYRIDHKFELGDMATLFFNDFGRILFFLCFSIYLFGDMSIYSAAVAKSLRDIMCDKQNNTITVTAQSFWLIHSASNDNETLCWTTHTMTRLHVYRLCLIGFTVLFGPFVCFSVQKTKYLQIATVVCRWLAFTFMISIAIKLLISDGAKGHPPSASVYGIPSLFGACVYSFMCHHSLPSLLAPIKDKLGVPKILLYDYIVICAFYILLAMTGIFAFAHIKDLYTLNFMPTEAKTNGDGIFSQLLIIIEYFLAFFPIFTLSTSYPIIGITLTNNLQSLFLDMSRFTSYNLFTRRILFPLCAVCPPFIITYFTESLTSLVAFTGSYAGTGIQYIIPVALIYYSRRTCKELLGNGIINPFQSPFFSNYWLLFVLLWSAVCVCLVTINFLV